MKLPQIPRTEGRTVHGKETMRDGLCVFSERCHSRMAEKEAGMTVSVMKQAACNRKERKEKSMEDFKFVVPDMPGTFGVLEFAGKGKDMTARVNGTVKVVSRQYHLFSGVQRADDVEVRIPGNVPVKEFDFEDRVELVNPRIIAEGYSIGDRAYVNYILLADDMAKAGQADERRGLG